MGNRKGALVAPLLLGFHVRRTLPAPGVISFNRGAPIFDKMAETWQCIVQGRGGEMEGEDKR